MNWRAHDLLWLDRSLLQARGGSLLSHSLEGIPHLEDIPHWVKKGRGPVVVRREKVSNPELIAVGVRGVNKSERFAAFAPIACVQTCRTPYDLAKSQGWLIHSDRFNSPVLQTVERVAQVLDGHGLQWGVTGSLGYELATGVKQIHRESDLDAVIASPQPLTRAFARGLLEELEQALDQRQELNERPCRLDIQIETAAGAFALLEWAGKSQSVLLKSETGPRLVVDPWIAEVA